MGVRISRRALIVLVAVATAVVPTAALAFDDADSDDGALEETRQEVFVDFDYNEMSRLLAFALRAADIPEPIDCAAPDGVTLGSSIDPDTGDLVVTASDGAWEAPERCTFVDVTGPNGQVNHGQVVSNFVHALKTAFDKSELGVPFGQLIKQMAGSDLGKGDQHIRVGDVDGEEDDDVMSDDLDGDNENSDDLDGDDDGDHGPPDHANNDKDKKPKKSGSNNGNGRGPNK